MDDLSFLFTMATGGVWILLILGAFGFAVWRKTTEDLTAESGSPGRLHQSVWVPVFETVFILVTLATLSGMAAMTLPLMAGQTGLFGVFGVIFILPLIGLFGMRTLPGFLGRKDIYWDPHGVTGPSGRYALRAGTLPWASLVRIARQNGNWVAEDQAGRTINIHSGYLGRGSFLKALHEHRPDLHSHLTS